MTKGRRFNVGLKMKEVVSPASVTPQALQKKICERSFLQERGKRPSFSIMMPSGMPVGKNEVCHIRMPVVNLAVRVVNVKMILRQEIALPIWGWDPTYHFIWGSIRHYDGYVGMALKLF